MASNERQKKNSVSTRINDRIDSTVLEARRIFIFDVIDSKSANDIIRKLWYLELTEPGKPILLIINSPGGSVDAGLAIWDQIHMISSPVTTLVSGLAASMGSILSLAATSGKRYATPYARFMLHQPLLAGVIKGQATDLEIHAREILKTKDQLVRIYVEKTGKDFKTIEKAIDRDMWLTAPEALEFKLIDKIVTSFDEL